MKIIWLAITVVPFLYSCTSKEQAPVYDQWIALGPDQLADWEHEGIETSWEDDILRLSGSNEGWLLSPEVYADFQWEMEAWAPKGGALVIRLSEPDEGHLVNIDFDSSALYPTGTILEVARASFLTNNEAETWHKIRVQAQGTLMEVFVDDNLVARGNDDSSLEGKIGFKTTGSEMRIRNQKILIWPQEASVPALLEDIYRADTSRQWQVFFENDLQGWNPIGDAQWDLQNGVLQGECGEQSGYLVSENHYKNFYLYTDFKIAHEDNSGIFIRKHPDSVNVTPQNAIECNIYDHNGPQHAFGTGSMVFRVRAWYGMIEYDDWNSMEIFARDDHLVVYVNGRKASESYVDESFIRSGQIALQAGTRVFSDNGPSRIYFKELKIKSMD